MSGPPPKPAGLRLIEGTDRKGRSGRALDRSKEPVVPEGELVAPYELSDQVQAVWDRTVRDLKAMDLASSPDAQVLAAYCEAVVLHHRAAKDLATADLVVMGAETQVVNKLILIIDRASRLILAFAREFGLTPSARMRVEVAGDGGGLPTAGANPFAG